MFQPLRLFFQALSLLFLLLERRCWSFFSPPRKTEKSLYKFITCLFLFCSWASSTSANLFCVLLFYLSFCVMRVLEKYLNQFSFSLLPTMFDKIHRCCLVTIWMTYNLKVTSSLTVDDVWSNFEEQRWVPANSSSKYLFETEHPSRSIDITISIL